MSEPELQPIYVVAWECGEYSDKQWGIVGATPSEEQAVSIAHRRMAEPFWDWDAVVFVLCFEAAKEARSVRRWERDCRRTREQDRWGNFQMQYGDWQEVERDGTDTDSQDERTGGEGPARGVGPRR